MIWVWAAIILWAHVGGQLFVSPYANRDVIVYVRRGAIEMPVNQTQANLDELSQIDSVLYNFLVSHSAQLIIKGFPDAVAGDTIGYSPQGRTFRKLDLTNIYEIRFPEGTQIDSIVAGLMSLPSVILVEKVAGVVPEVIPNDGLFSLQMSLMGT